jgi:acyl-CoA reductase-like NAD-dependent aldehyde dehydrogenase
MISRTQLPVDDPVADWCQAGPKRLIIGGEAVEAASGQAAADRDPGTGQTVTEVCQAGPEDVDRAVAAARDGFSRWSATPPLARAKTLYRLTELMERDAKFLAQLETLDTGKPLRESRGDIGLAIEVFRYFAGWVTKIHGETLPVSSRGEYLCYTRREPLGVVAGIVPWNFPLLIGSWKAAPALAAGNCVILKPASDTPLTAIRLGELAIEAGLPAGTLNVLPGPGARVGQALADHPGIQKVAFTGSTETGKQIATSAAGTVKRVQLELGGKSPNIVFADAPLPAAVKGAFFGIFMNQGEVCAAGSRVFVERSIYDGFVEALGKQAEATRVGHGLDDKTQMGPVVSQRHLETVLDFVASGRSEGARLVAGGERPGGELGEGYYLKPTVFADVEDGMRIAREEIFGPVVAVLPFQDVDEVIDRANSSPFGLAAGVWTTSVGRAHHVAARLQSGTVWVNCYNVYDPVASFGGYKESGYGRDMGAAALADYTQLKTIWVNLTAG